MLARAIPRSSSTTWRRWQSSASVWAALARRNVAAFPAVDVVTGDFETWRPSARAFDAVVAFTAFHWLDPQLRYEKSAALLREGGSLAVAETRHVLPQNGDDFFADVQEDYRAVIPDEDDGPPPRPEDVPDLSDEIGASGHFEQATVERYVWDVIYTATSYIDVLDTYSGHRALEKAAREELYARIRRPIEARPGGILRKSYLATLNVARRR